MEDTLMTKYRSVYRTILLSTLDELPDFLAGLGRAQRGFAGRLGHTMATGRRTCRRATTSWPSPRGNYHSLALRSDGSLAGWG